MKLAAVAIIAFTLTWAFIGLANGQTTSRIEIASSLVSVRESEDVRTDILLLWNREVRTRPIGHAVVSCFEIHAGGIAGDGFENCTAYYQLPLGKITAAGEIHARNHYTLVITGGSGAYKGAAGHLFTLRVGPGLKRVTFNL